MDHKQSQDNQAEQSPATASADGRRKFLQKATAGALIATIPAKSVWATGLTNSIVASGNGSDVTGGNGIYLRDVYFWTSNIHLVPSVRFIDVFNGPMIENANKGVFNGKEHKEKTLADVLTEKNETGNDLKYRGPSDVNLQLVAVYLNAKFSGQHGIHFPIIGITGKPYVSAEAMAKGMYKTAMHFSGSPGELGLELAMLNGNNTSML